MLERIEWQNILRTISIAEMTKKMKASFLHNKTQLRYHVKSPVAFRNCFKHVEAYDYGVFNHLVEDMRKELFEEMFPGEPFDTSHVVKDLSSSSSALTPSAESSPYSVPKLSTPELKYSENKEDEYVAVFGNGFGQYVLMLHERELKNKHPSSYSYWAGTDIADMKRYLNNIIDDPSTFAFHCRSRYVVPNELIEPMRKTLLKERLLRELRAPEDAKIDESSTKDLNASAGSSLPLPILKPRLVFFRKDKNVDEKKEQSSGRSEEKCYKIFGLFQRKNGARKEIATYKCEYGFK